MRRRRRRRRTLGSAPPVPGDGETEQGQTHPAAPLPPPEPFAQLLDEDVCCQCPEVWHQGKGSIQREPGAVALTCPVGDAAG